eukprot:TRINITY_DN92584_c0_g1_i1.p1 TRINITY_DN92584_c0_g1~~TRINITY_DN92584_c0_g1_i1.p1  ORF type:complete len:112 (-),score=22.90 TRINITY_DN92584_c0_g1_i1:210-497(-)
MKTLSVPGSLSSRAAPWRSSPGPPPPAPGAGHALPPAFSPSASAITRSSLDVVFKDEEGQAEATPKASMTSLSAFSLRPSASAPKRLTMMCIAAA